MATRALSTRRATNVSLDARAVAEARELGINISQACERGLVGEIKTARERRWREDNRPIMQEWNDWVERNGLPLAHLRQF